MTVLFCNSCTSSEQSPNNGCAIAECVNGGNSNISSVILCNNCLAKTLSNRDTALRFNESQQQLKSNEMDNYGRKRLDDLNVDVLSLIFDELTIVDMMNLCHAYPIRILSTVAKYSFWRRYKDYTVQMKNYAPNDGNHITLDNDLKCIQVGRKKSAKVFRIFGNVIHQLEISYPSIIIVQFMNRYMRHTLVRLHLNSIDENAVSHFTKPFTAVEELELSFGYTYQSKEHLKCNQVFYNIRQLTLHSNVDYNFIDCALPFLEHLQSHTIYTSDEMKFEKFLSKNAQLRSIETKYLSGNVCNAINRYVPNLESLTLSSAAVTNETRFECVKHLKIHNSNSIVFHEMRNLLFPCLESLQIIYAHEIFNVSGEFIRKHKTISHLKVLDFKRNGHQQFVQLLVELPNLREITLQLYYGDINIESISEIVGGHQQLQKLHLTELSSWAIKSLRKRCANDFDDWNITENDENIGIFSLERKQ